jgi:hypothetical protein
MEDTKKENNERIREGQRERKNNSKLYFILIVQKKVIKLGTVTIIRIS